MGQPLNCTEAEYTFIFENNKSKGILCDILVWVELSFQVFIV